MGLILAGIAVWALWLGGTGRLKRLSLMDGMAIGLGLVGLVMAAKGRILIGGGFMVAALAYESWRRKKAARLPASAGAADIAEACALLGLAPGADIGEIRAAHRRLIALAHPDKGGTPALAARINDARDLRLKGREPK